MGHVRETGYRRDGNDTRACPIGASVRAVFVWLPAFRLSCLG